MNSFLNNQARLILSIILIVGSIIAFVYSWLTPMESEPLDKFFWWGAIMLVAASFHLKKIEDEKK